MTDTAKIRIGIAGYGNLGQGVVHALQRCPDMQLAGIFTRRKPENLQTAAPDVPVWHIDSAAEKRSAIDVLILCGGSRSDLPEQGPLLAQWYNTVDSFDTHARIPEYFSAMDAAAQSGNNLAMISVGWDPGLFSINRVMGEAILPQGSGNTFWGKGLSQGHSDAIRRIPGVLAGAQYTIPVESAVAQVRAGAGEGLTTRDKHTRECFVVLQDPEQASAIEQAIVTMPDYFADYDTRVHFISAAEFERDHGGMPHGGFVIRSGQTGQGNRQVIEYALKLASNPEFTSSVLVAYARAAWRLKCAGQSGACSVLDVPPGLLSPKSGAQLRQQYL